MSLTTDGDGGPIEVPPAIVRDIAQSRPTPGDFRDQFPEAQPDIDDFIGDVLEAEGEVAAAFCGRLAAAIWAMYDESLDEPLGVVPRDRLEAFFPVAQSLVETFAAKHPGEGFDPEWLVEMPKGAQPHVMGFLIGAIRAARFDIDADALFAITVTLLAVAGGLEEAAGRAPRSP